MTVKRKKRFIFGWTLWVIATFLVAGGSALGVEQGQPSSPHQPGPVKVGPSVSCTLPPLDIPETPAKIPGYTELDPTTGLHVTGGIQQIDAIAYRLEVTGKVKRRLSLSYDDLRCMPRVASRPDLVCPGFFKDVATWAGTPLKYILELAGVESTAASVRLTGADAYSASMTVEQAISEGNFLAYEWEHKALPRLHGFPVRGVFPAMEGNQWVKWLIKIEVY
jgi:DMSO/TMAO reductase YedYZ molybdopterin-dependent catalytic subunit